jgi:chorismate mutase
MAEKRHLELHLLRLLPNALKDDFVTVGLVLLESDGGFADLRVTRDWRMLQCVAPNVETEWFGIVENEIRGRLGLFQRRDELLQLVNERFGSMIDVAPTKAVSTDDPAKEMEVLASIYLAPVERGERVQQRSGRGVIVSLMNDAFAAAGVLELMQRDLDMSGYLGTDDRFSIDFGYRVGNAIKMLHAVSLRANADQAQLFAYRYSRIEEGMRREQLQPSLIAVVDRAMEMRDERARLAIGMMEQNSMRVRVVGEIGEIADEVRRELRV